MLKVNRLSVKIKYAVSFTVAFALLILCVSITGNAVSLQGSITVQLNDKDDNAINDISVLLYEIASLDNEYYESESFKNSGISIDGVVNNPSAETAQDIYKYIVKNNIAGISNTSINGNAGFSGLQSGIYLIACADNQACKFNPYLVFIPDKDTGDLNVITAPKTEENLQNNKNIYVVKKWQDSNNIFNTRPDSIDVNLKRNDDIIEKISLNKENGWSYTFTKLQDEGEYTVEEEYVSGYIAYYSGNAEDGFIITNVYNADKKLPQTGLLWWPVPIIVFVGVVFVVSGIIVIKGKNNEEK